MFNAHAEFSDSLCSTLTNEGVKVAVASAARAIQNDFPISRCSHHFFLFTSVLPFFSNVKKKLCQE
jgi:hypothetical protein